jgi:translation initiation factor IF-2
VKADVQGSAEAIVQAMEKIGNDEVRVRVLHYGVGAITESDIGLAEASGAPGHRLQRPGQRTGANSANQKGVEIRYYSVIYDLVDDVKAAASGLLVPRSARTSSAMPRSRRSSRSPVSARSPVAS